VTVEARLRDATATYTERIEPSIDGWQRLAERFEPRRPRPWLITAGAFLLVIASVAAVYAFMRDGSDSRAPIASPRAPSRIVAVTNDGRVVVIDPADGHEIRQLAVDAQPQGGVAVSVDGRMIYYARLSGAVCNAFTGDSFSVTDLAVISVRGGAPKILATYARSPSVSPDGRLLAYVRAPCGTAGTAAVVRGPGHDKGSDWGTGWPSPGDPLDRVSWAPDSRHLAFDQGYPYVFDASSKAGPASSRRVDIGDGTVWFGYRGSRDQFLAFRFASSEPANIVVLGPDGLPRQQLFTLPGSSSPSSLVSDRSGLHILFVDAESWLSRWRPGQTKPTKVAPGFAGAVWVPTPRP
jgi:hypothetical protein